MGLLGDRFKESKSENDLHFNANLLYELIKELDPSINKEGNSFSLFNTFPYREENEEPKLKLATLHANKTSDGRIDLYIEGYANIKFLRYPDQTFLYLINFF